MTRVPTTYNVAKFDNVCLEYQLISPEKITQDSVIVLLYGLVCNNRHWEFQLDYFLDKGFQVLLHNYRFHFGSVTKNKNIEEECTFKNMALDFETLVNHLNLNNLFLVGHSMGVNVSAEIIRQTDLNILGQVLISGNPLDPRDTMFNTDKSHEVLPVIQSIMKKNPKLFNLFWKNAHKLPLVRKVVLHGGFNPEMIKDEFVEYYLKKIGELQPEVFFKLIDEMGRQSLISYLPNINTPTLVMGGDRDTIAPISSQLIFNNLIQSSEFYLIKDGSHVPQADFPQSVNERIYEFILKN